MMVIRTAKRSLSHRARQAHVVTCGTEDGIDGIAFEPGKMISFQMAIVLEMADDRFDGGSTAHLAPDGW